MRILALESEEGQVRKNVSCLFNPDWRDIEIVVMNLSDDLPDIKMVSPIDDYFSALQKIPDHVSKDIINSISYKIMDDLLNFDYIVVPVGSTNKDLLVNYIVSWIISYYEGMAPKAVYYVDKEAITHEGFAQDLYNQFADLFDLEEIYTYADDILFLDMEDRLKGFFRKMTKERKK